MGEGIEEQSVRESPMTVQSFFYLLLVTASSPSLRD